MRPPKTIHDPKGREVIIPGGLSGFDQRLQESIISEVVSAPKFIIDVKGTELYFIKLIEWDQNMLVKATSVGWYFVVESLIQNPSAETVAALLTKGCLTSY